MVCFHPLKGFPVGVTKNNKVSYKITGYSINHVELITKSTDDNTDDYQIVESYLPNVSPNCRKAVFDFIEIPCGQCKGCRMDYARQWADRCMMEMQYHEESWFVTLTYADSFLPTNHFTDYDTGETGTVSTLVKRDLVLFMKRLRSRLSYPVRFFAAGEYGDQTGRPHYHLILFGLHGSDLKNEFWKQSELGFNYYVSNFLQDVWSKGRVIVAQANWPTCCYTAKYILKKQRGSGAEIYETYNFEPPFTLMSRKPGIGRDFWDEKGLSLIAKGSVAIGSEDGSRRIYPPRYFKQLFAKIDPDAYEDWKNMRLDACDGVRQAKLSLTTQNFLDELETEEAVLGAKLAAFKRKSC